MEAAVAHFRSRMAASNRNYLAARIAEQRGQPLSEDSKVFAMSRVWFRWGESHKAWRRIPPPGDDASPQFQEQYRLESAVRTLDDVAQLPHRHMDGTELPFDEAVRRRFVRALETVAKDYADVELLGSDYDIRVPAELDQFLALTNGAHDPDFRHSGICDFSPLLFGNEREEVMRNMLETMADRDDWPSRGVEFLQDEFDVAAGILVAEAGQRPELWPERSENKWISMYALCCTAGAEDESWAWRVIFYHRIAGLEYRAWAFDSIVEFLDWYSSWDSRLGEVDSADALTNDSEAEHQIAGYKPGEGIVE